MFSRCSSGTNKYTIDSAMFRLVLTILVLALVHISVKSYETVEDESYDSSNDDYDHFPQFGMKDGSSSPVVLKPKIKTKTLQPAFLPTTVRTHLNTNKKTEERPITNEIIKPTTPSSNIKRKPHIRRRLNSTRIPFSTTTKEPIPIKINPETKPKIVRQAYKPVQLNETILSSESSPTAVSSPPYSDYDYSNRNGPRVQFDLFSPSAPFLSTTPTKLLFSPNVQAPKFKIDESGFAFFNIKHDYTSKPKNSQLSKPKPLDFNLKTDLSVANLPLQTYPQALDHDPTYSRPHLYRDNGHSAASKKQIHLYNEDIRQKHDNAIESHLLNSNNPADKAKYYQFLKAKEDEKVERQSISIKEQLQRRPVNFKFRPIIPNQATHIHFKIKQPQLQVQPILQPKIQSQSPGLKYYKGPSNDRSSNLAYSYPFL